MNKKEIEERMLELKMDYARIQGDIEKLESTGKTVRPLERHLQAIEEELRELRQQFTK